MPRGGARLLESASSCTLYFQLTPPPLLLSSRSPPRPLPAGKLRVIAEPGRYFAEAFATYACFINGWRERVVEGTGERQLDYYITDGLYGSMNW